MCWIPTAVTEFRAGRSHWSFRRGSRISMRESNLQPPNPIDDRFLVNCHGFEHIDHHSPHYIYLWSIYLPTIIYVSFNRSYLHHWQVQQKVMETGTTAVGYIYIYIYIPMVIPSSYLYIQWTKLQVKPLISSIANIYIYIYTYIYIYITLYLQIHVTYICIYISLHIYYLWLYIYIYVIIHVYYVYFSTEPPFLLAFIISVHYLTSTLNAPLRFDQDILRNMSQKLSDREALKKPFRRKARRCALFGPP